MNAADLDKWMGLLQEVSMTIDISDFYTIIKHLGVGAMG
jgi:hypothetical protein